MFKLHLTPAPGPCAQSENAEPTLRAPPSTCVRGQGRGDAAFPFGMRPLCQIPAPSAASLLALFKVFVHEAPPSGDGNASRLGNKFTHFSSAH